VYVRVLVGEREVDLELDDDVVVGERHEVANEVVAHDLRHELRAQHRAEGEHDHALLGRVLEQ